MKRLFRLFYYVRKLGIIKAMRRTLISKTESNKIAGFVYRVIDALCINKYKEVKKYQLNEVERDQRIIVSLTTIPERIEYASVVIGIMLSQTVKPDKIQLYLGEKEFKGKELPPLIVEQENIGVEILYVEDLKPHTKYFYAMKNNPNDIVITVDDDILYDEFLIENLLGAYKQYPNAVVAMRVHKMIFNERNQITTYDKWKYCCSEHILEPRMDLLATGVGGVLYPPMCISEEVFRKDIFEKYCPYADDIWLKVVQAISHVPCVLVKEHIETQCLTGSQSVGLHYENVLNNKNDVQLRDLIYYYNQQRNINVVELLNNKKNASL